ncbi:universal stress protein [Mucilaginibacter paludis]|uniref:UspA domain-containing protein n=1 Tax=Mucilaginibacter paludis DSM 18603 TaxID=714943 RepID=H1Y6M2_9SPHI|nr:universal stress protein [Mucilaginibacter paludis]EHQ26814.1 UspA domain-containing protein [Mucilaginibacter paludis DSM 18603]
MKTILVPTDFSPAADNAARYALNLARYMHADVKLCSAINEKAKTRITEQLVWPHDDYSSVKETTDQELRILAKRLSLEQSLKNEPASVAVFEPNLTYCCKAGSVMDAVRDLVTDEKITMVVMGLWGATGINSFFAGSVSQDMIDKASFPLLLMPGKAQFTSLRSIAFATDLSEEDIEVIHSLASLAREFNAEILIVHVMDGKHHNKEYQQKVSNFLSGISDKVDYPHIYYRDVKSTDVDKGLSWIVEHRQIQMIAMVHRKHDLLDRIFKESYTKNLAKHTEIPLLVFPYVGSSVVF